MLPGNDLGNQTSETQLPNGRGASLVLPLPSNGSLANKRFRIVVSGRVATTITNTFTINVYSGFAPVIASNLLIFSTGPQSVNSISSNYSMTIDLFWSTGNRTINGGPGQGQMANSPIGPASLNNPVVNADPNRDSNPFLQSGATYGFTLTGQFGSGSAGNHAFVDIFELEEL
jgi:hypothetical protein